MIHILPEIITSSHPMGLSAGPNHRECKLKLKFKTPLAAVSGACILIWSIASCVRGNAAAVACTMVLLTLVPLYCLLCMCVYLPAAPACHACVPRFVVPAARPSTVTHGRLHSPIHPPVHPHAPTTLSTACPPKTVWLSDSNTCGEHAQTAHQGIVKSDVELVDQLFGVVEVF